MASPKPIPTELARTRGTFRPDRHPDESSAVHARAATRLPAPPAVVAALPDALEAWKRQGAVLLAMRSMTVGDWEIFESYCLALARMRMAAVEWSKGILEPAEDGILRRNPATGVATEAERALRAAAAELGLTPSARRKVSAVQDIASDQDADFD